MIIDDNRKPFEDALADPANTFLLVFGESNPLAVKIHDMASDSNVVEDSNKAVVFKNVSVLTDDEKKAWFGGEDKYTMLSKCKSDLPNQLPTPHCRKVVEQNLLTALCAQGVPSQRKIPIAFGKADAA
jgi:hypothetical protein